MAHSRYPIYDEVKTMTSTIVSDALIVADQHPRRRLMSFFIRNYSITVSAFISLILALSMIHYGLLWMLGVLGSYWIYVGLKQYSQRNARFRTVYKAKYVQFARSLALILAVTAGRTLLFRYVPHLQAASDTDTLWLLYLLATLIMSQRGSTELLLVTIFLAVVGLVLTDVLRLSSFATSSLTPWLETTLKAMWLVLLAFVHHILLRYMADVKYSVEAVTVVQKRITDEESKFVSAPSSRGEKQVLDTAVESIAAAFRYPHVNVFYTEPNRTIACVAGACQGGKALVEEDFRLQPGKGIIGHVIQSGETYASNDVDKDRYYYHHTRFPNTRAELVFPIRVRDKIVGALDVQVHRTNHFFERDVEILSTIADQLGRVLDNIRTHSHRHSINKIIRSIAHRLLSHTELEDTLHEIAQAAHEELGADLVVLYEYDSIAGNVMGPVYAGTPRQPAIFGKTELEADSLVYQLIASGPEFYFHKDLSQVSDKALTAPAAFHRRTGKPTFVEREGIQARCIARLQTDCQCVGLMFLNYRLPRHFSEQDRTMVRTFAHLAALSIQKAHLHEQQLELERHSLAQDMHDQLMGNIYGLSQMLEGVLCDQDLQERHRKHLGTAQQAVQDLRRDIRHLNMTLEGKTLGDFSDEVDRLTRYAQRVYGAEVSTTWIGNSSRIPPTLARHLSMVLREAIFNGVRHGQAKNLALTFEIETSQVRMEIEDNGRGFSIDGLEKEHGIANMRERLERLGGSLSVESQPGRGARVTAIAPMRVAQQHRLSRG